MAAFAQLPIPMVNCTPVSVQRRSHGSNPWGTSYWSLAKPVPRLLPCSSSITDANPPPSGTILHGRPGTDQGEELPPYSLDNDLPVYTTSDEVSQPEPGHSIVPKYLTKLVTCQCGLDLFFVFEEDIEDTVCRVPEIGGIVAKAFITSLASYSGLTRVADGKTMERQC